MKKPIPAQERWRHTILFRREESSNTQIWNVSWKAQSPYSNNHQLPSKRSALRPLLILITFCKIRRKHTAIKERLPVYVSIILFSSFISRNRLVCSMIAASGAMKCRRGSTLIIKSGHSTYKTPHHSTHAAIADEINE
jgi:hypothetical protein